MKRFTLYLATLLISGIAFAQEAPVVVAVVAGSADVAAGRAVMQEAYKQIGVPVEFRDFPAAEALGMSSEGNVDAELQRIDGISNKFTGLVQVPIPINVIQGAVFSKKYRFPIMGWHSLRPYKIGIVRGILFAEQQTVGMDRVVLESYKELIEALQNDVIDVGVMLRIGALDTIQQLEADGIYEMEGVLETLFLYHYVHVSRGDLVEKLEPVLKNMLLNGETRQKREQVIAVIKARQ